MAAEGKKNGLAKLFRLWAVYARMDFLWVTRDFRFCLICVVSDFVLGLAGVVAVFLLAERFDGIGQWSKVHVIFMLGYATAVTGLMNTFCAFNVLHVSRRIGRGQLDHSLIQPQPLWLSLATEGFMPFSGSAVLWFGLGILVWAARQLSLGDSPWWWALLAVNLVSSSGVIVAYSFLWSSLAFWAPCAAEEVSSSASRILFDLRVFPLDGVGGLLGIGLVSLLPVGFTGWYPSRYLLGLDHAAVAPYATPAAAIVLILLAWGAFRKGLQHYERTGSSRYLDMGHRS